MTRHSSFKNNMLSSASVSKLGLFIGLLVTVGSFHLSQGFVQPAGFHGGRQLCQSKIFVATVNGDAVAINGDYTSSSKSMSSFATEEETDDDIDAIDANSLYDKSFNITDYVPIEPATMVSPFSPPLTFDKYLTMQDKRVTVSIRYTEDSGLKPYFLTVAKRIKNDYPDVRVTKDIIPATASIENDRDDDARFEVVVDGKTIVGNQKKGRRERYGSGRGDVSVFVSISELDLAIKRARRKRRPQTVYGEQANSLRLEMLRRRPSTNNRKSSS